MRIIFLHLSLLLTLYASSQSINNYSIARTTGISYGSISSTGNAVNTWRNSGAYSQDDNRSYFINIGFDFWYNGVRYTQVSVSTNGYLDFSNSSDDGGPTADDFGYNNSAFSASTSSLATRPACAVFYDDLTAQGGSDPLGNSIRYSVSGTAPNRVFTMEWINMAVYTNTTPDLNFQVKLYETSGLIEFNYGTMNTGTFTFSYTLGINAPTVSSPPTISQLKNQITANTTTFSNTPQNNLSTLPANNSNISFASPVPANPSGSLTFSSVTQTSMTLNWSNWATNEVGYVIYYSTDGINYSFLTQTAANATSNNVTGLLPGTTYYWKVYAVTEGTLSNALSGTQATLPAGNKVSNVATGNWNNPGSWLPVGVPSPTDNVTILNGHTITINSDVFCNRLTVGQGVSGALIIGNNNTARNLTINENMIINNGASLYTNTASNATHLCSYSGNITNNGTINFASDANSLCNFTFVKNGNQSVSGTGSSTFNLVTINMGSSELNTLTISTPTFIAPTNFLTLSNGTIKIQSSNVTTYNLFTTASTTIGPSSGIWFSNANATLNLPVNITLEGNLRVDAGICNVGDVANESLTSNGGELTVTGGTLNVAGRYTSSGINNLSRFVMSGGTMVVPKIGSSGSTTIAPFNVTSAGSVVIISGGTIVIPFEGGTGAQDLGYTISNVINSNVTGGILQIGNSSTTAGQTMKINTVLPIGNLLINSNNATGLLANDLTVRSNVTITTGLLNTLAFNLSLGGNWIDNANFNPGTGTVTFNGSVLQTITDPTGERYNNLTIGSTNIVRYNCALDIDKNLVINSGASFDAGVASNQLAIQGNFTNNGTVIPQLGLYLFNGTTAQTMNASSLTSFYNLSTNNTSGVNISSGNYEISGAYTPISGSFNVTGATAFTLLSNALTTARIGQAGTGTVTGDMNMQRYISARAAGYSDMSSPAMATTFADWDNELLLVYAYSPPATYPSCWSYDETAWNYVPVTSSVTAITKGLGYEVYLDSDGTYTSFNNTTIDTKGNPTIGNVDISSSITFNNDGWNLVGNPYASYISWDNLYSTLTNVSTDIMIYDEVAGDFELFSTGAGVEIAPHQGFWIQVLGAPTFQFTEAVKTTSNNSNFKYFDEQVFSITASCLDKVNWFSSKATFPINSDSKFKNDIKFKGIAHPNAPNFYYLNETQKPYRLHNLYSNSEEQKVQLGFNSNLEGNYLLTFNNIEKAYSLYNNCVVLHDKLLDVYVNLNADSEGYKFYHSTNASLKSTNRFELIFSNTNVCLSNDNNGNIDVNISQTIEWININVNTSESIKNGSIKLYDALGRSIGQAINVNSVGDYKLSMQLVTGVYFIKVDINNSTTIQKVVIP